MWARSMRRGWASAYEQRARVAEALGREAAAYQRRHGGSSSAALAAVVAERRRACAARVFGLRDARHAGLVVMPCLRAREAAASAGPRFVGRPLVRDAELVAGGGTYGWCWEFLRWGGMQTAAGDFRFLLRESHGRPLEAIGCLSDAATLWRLCERSFSIPLPVSMVCYTPHPRDGLPRRSELSWWGDAPSDVCTCSIDYASARWQLLTLAPSFPIVRHPRVRRGLASRSSKARARAAARTRAGSAAGSSATAGP